MATIVSIEREEQGGFDKAIIKLSNDTYIVVGISAQELCCEDFGITECYSIR